MSDYIPELDTMIRRAAALDTKIVAENDQLAAAALERARKFGVQLRDGLDYEGVWYPVPAESEPEQ